MDLYKEHDDLKTKLIEKISSETNQSKLIKIKELLESND